MIWRITLVVLAVTGALIVLNQLMIVFYIIMHHIGVWLHHFWKQVHMREYHNFYKNNPTVAPPTNNKRAKEKD